MKDFKAFETMHRLDIEGLLSNIRREGTPRRVFFMELFYDTEIGQAVGPWVSPRIYVLTAAATFGSV